MFIINSTAYKPYEYCTLSPSDWNIKKTLRCTYRRLVLFMYTLNKKQGLAKCNSTALNLMQIYKPTYH